MNVPLTTAFARMGTTAILLASSTALALDKPPTSIGLYTAVKGNVAVIHPGHSDPGKIAVHDDVFFRDVIATEPASRTKALFQDDSVLTVGESSRVEVTEHIYNPSESKRSTVINLMQGKLRALVGRTFVGKGSRFEVHTPTSVVAARGTYFTVWVEEKTRAQAATSGVANIGDHGKVEFTSGGKTVVLRPGQFSIALPGKPPATPVMISPTAPVEVMNSIAGTEVSDVLRTETPRQTLQAIRGITPVTPTSPSQGASTIQATGSSSTTNKIVTETTGLSQSVTSTLNETVNSTANRLTETTASVTESLTGTARSLTGLATETVGGTTGSYSDLSTTQTDPARTLQPATSIEPIAPAQSVQTVEPTLSVEPVSYVEPIRTVEPVTTIEPVSAVEPVTAIEPTRTVEPVAATVEPILTVEPVRAIEPVVVDPILHR